MRASVSASTFVGCPPKDDSDEIECQANDTPQTSSGHSASPPSPTSIEERRRRRKCPHNKISFNDLGKMIGMRWRYLSETAREKYKILAAQDKVRYENEKTEASKQAMGS